MDPTVLMYVHQVTALLHSVVSPPLTILPNCQVQNVSAVQKNVALVKCVTTTLKSLQHPINVIVVEMVAGRLPLMVSANVVTTTTIVPIVIYVCPTMDATHNQLHPS